jgi:FixJ family two-component response regulator
MLEYMKSNNIDIPLIFLSSHTDPEFEAKGLRLGAAEYIKKTANKKIMLETIKKVIHSKD